MRYAFWLTCERRSISRPEKRLRLHATFSRRLLNSPKIHFHSNLTTITRL